MMCQERFFSALIEDPGLSGDMALGEMPLEAERIPHDEIPIPQGRVALGGMSHQVMFEECEERLAVHRQGPPTKAPNRPLVECGPDPAESVRDLT